MRLEYVALQSGRVLDTIDVDVTGARPVAYATGRARGTVDTVRRRGGLRALDGWTNGYVALRPLSD